MKLISWNVNGLRACIGKGFEEYVRASGADVICLQETKMQPGQADIHCEGYIQYWNSAVRKGYSGTAVFTKTEPLSAAYGLGEDYVDDEGRAITLDFGAFYLINLYVPNAQEGLKRLDYRMTWEDKLRRYAKGLEKRKPVIICGDMNVAHREIDLKNPKSNRGQAGFSDEERAKMSQLLGSGFIDTYRMLYPDKTGAYSWWSYRFNARANNAGWRIDYFIVSQSLGQYITDAFIQSEVTGSDHCPVGIEINLSEVI